jgi:hypothetical protein
MCASWTAARHYLWDFQALFRGAGQQYEEPPLSMLITHTQVSLLLQGVLDFCNQLSFIRNLYLNLDCRIERNNLFEAIASLLSKTAFPVNSPLGSVHLLSLEGLFSILSALSAS